MVSGLRPLAVCSRRIKPCQYRRCGGLPAAREVGRAQGGVGQREPDMRPIVPVRGYSLSERAHPNAFSRAARRQAPRRGSLRLHEPSLEHGQVAAGARAQRRKPASGLRAGRPLHATAPPAWGVDLWSSGIQAVDDLTA